jgi:glycosyltransferase involved in cell wall biosynthesis
VTYQGNDARQGDYCRKNFKISPANELQSDYYNPKIDELKRKRIAVFSRNADRIYALNPDLFHVLPSSAIFLPYAHIDLADWVMKPTEVKVNTKPVVVHAPSHRGFKGTRFIIEAVNRLQAENIEIDFVLVEGVSNQEARRQYERADLLVDQLLAGWYGGLALELMSLGKPVVCYIREEDLRFIPSDMAKELPIINSTPDTIYEVLKHWLTDGRSRLKELGAQSRHFAEKWHDPMKIAAQVKKDYEDILVKKGKLTVTK